ncbi:tyrosine-type recombinase/integrase [Sphingomonas sp. PB4P5]|uniref:tyrosine-type recombinase/integrase n=1 Tax=Parasphingomonas puruogangriensis TaxID=3096155 RepID=UPI002FCAAFFE
MKPLIGSRKAKALATHEIESFQADIAAGKTARGRVKARGRETSGGYGAASRTFSTLHAIFGHVKRLGEIEANPATGVRRMASQPRMRRLSADELIALGEAMRQCAQHDESESGLAALRYLTLTGFRLNEAQKLERNWPDFDSGCVRFPDTKRGSQFRVMGNAASAVIKGRCGRGREGFVFRADGGDGHYKQLPDLIQRATLAAELPGVTAHTLRHTFGSVACDRGFSELTIAGLLGHGKRGVTQGYIHIEDGLRIAAERVAACIGDLLDGKRTSIRDMDIAIAA